MGGAIILVVLLQFAPGSAYIPEGRTTAMAASSDTATNDQPTITQHELAAIQNSGSTNTLPYTITLYQDGSGTVTLQKEAHIDIARHYMAGTFDAQQLTRQLQEVGDVSSIPYQPCLKSTSFGTRTTITYHGKTSPDLSCPGSNLTPAQKTLIDTVMQWKTQAIQGINLARYQ
jgi:hypothetical protein